jgi:hypothetical protein
MLDFARVRAKELSIQELCAGLSADDLRRLTHEMIDQELALIAGCVDADVTFVPQDPDANDEGAATPEEVKMAWTLAHVIVHATASSEEAAFIAAEMARGVPQREGRSRFETPWPTVTTVAQCRGRLEESRRMPDPPHMEPWEFYGKPQNAIVRFVRGLNHDYNHLGQIAEIVRQATAGRA